ncbi:type ISP restriction/modification enzyme [Streptomyces kanamyceticus]|uniref:site-specific DNA-methyltransferase (adenine-specific) n=1 Tax=Streptomyces kanamyceticus TaxID=1967 RepID=A0A5J6G9L3_STRKN|nr:type ISP restriction/modification enzyme [Streptomyces kanamyceticus]QEU91304.1 N-6 DNA methylase [Streptomyces kanamyceticus]
MQRKERFRSIVSEFGATCKQALLHGQKEAAIRRAVETLLVDSAGVLGLQAVLHAEVAIAAHRIRPDLAVRIGKLPRNIVGYVELKSPDKSTIHPGGLNRRDRRQWEGMAKLPNLIYTNGQTWIMYRSGQQYGDTIHFEGDLRSAGSHLRLPAASGAAFEAMLVAFFGWQPRPLTSMREVVTQVAPLCTLLRDAVHDRLDAEAILPRHQRPFTDLASTLEVDLFPTTDGRDKRATFADRYAQSVTFALLLASSDTAGDKDKALIGMSLHEVGRRLGAEHSVMGRALQILTDQVEGEFRDSLDMLVRVIDAIDWKSALVGEPGFHIHLYEHFLQEYDAELRKDSGTYYTPAPLVTEMIRLVDEVLATTLDCPDGFADPGVSIIDPSMGTGTFLTGIIDLVASKQSEGGNEGFRAESVQELASRLIGFEKQMGPFAVAQMRVGQMLRHLNARVRLRDMRLHLADTLADPWRPSELFDRYGALWGPLRDDAEAASTIQRNERITVVIGNPPHREQAEGQGGWIEKGSPGRGAPPLDDFRLRGAAGAYENKLKSLCTYFWRWATHKVFDQYGDHRHGVVCFVSTGGFIRSAGFQGMRSYLRCTCTEGWVIDLTPETKRPPLNSRFFPGVQQELAIAIFVRRQGKRQEDLAPVHYAAVHGTRQSKEEQLHNLHISGPGWRTSRSVKHAPFTPAPQSGWDTFPALTELMPWCKPGIKTNRNWVISPSKTILQRRWNRLVQERDPATKQELFKETRDRTLDKEALQIPGHPHPPIRLRIERGPCPNPIRIARRALDRQWLIPDGRVIDYSRPELWQADIDGQIFVAEQHTQRLQTGAGLLFTALVPDMHYFNGNGGRVLPLMHADRTPNITPGLLPHLANSYGLQQVLPKDLLAYIAAVTAHPAFTERYADDLNSLGVRVPLTSDRDLWHEAISVGHHVLWASTFGTRCIDPDDGRPAGTWNCWRRLHPEITYAREIASDCLPSAVNYDVERQHLVIEGGIFTGVTPRMRDYSTGGRNVLDSWLAYRSDRTAGKITSELDRERPERWEPEWSRELVEVLAVLRHLTTLEPQQAELLDRIVAAPTIDVAELTRRHILPVPERAQHAHTGADHAFLPGMDTVDGQPPSPVEPLSLPNDPADTTPPKSPSPTHPAPRARRRRGPA